MTGLAIWIVSFVICAWAFLWAIRAVVWALAWLWEVANPPPRYVPVMYGQLAT